MDLEFTVFILSLNACRTAVSLGGNCDTLTCIAGSIAEAFYGIPAEMVNECRRRMPEDMLAVIDRFDESGSAGKEDFHDMVLEGNEMIAVIPVTT